MSQIFGHGRLKLYVLKLLDEGARHGYELIRQLEDRFMGLYAPSPGTIYPRLQRMEADGLVTHTRKGGRKVYEITDAGREELRRREDELAALEADIHKTLQGLAEKIRDSAGNLQVGLTQAARELRQQQRFLDRERIGQGLEHLGSNLGSNLGTLGDNLSTFGNNIGSHLSGGQLGDLVDNLSSLTRSRRGGAEQASPTAGAGTPPAADGKSLDRHLVELITVVRQVAQKPTLTEAQLRDCRAILDDALTRIRETLRRAD